MRPLLNPGGEEPPVLPTGPNPYVGPAPEPSDGGAPTGPVQPTDPTQEPTGPSDSPLQLPPAPPAPPPSNTPTGIGGTFARPGTAGAARFANNRLLGMPAAAGQRFGAGVPLAGNPAFADFMQPAAGGDQNDELIRILAAAAGNRFGGR